MESTKEDGFLVWVMYEHSGYTEMNSKFGFRHRQQPLNLKPACIAQPVQVELLQRRLRLVQI
jgi:hypothetical protein